MPSLPVDQVRITPRAQRDLDDIYNYLMIHASPAVARRELARLITAIRGLRRMPCRFAVPRSGRRQGTALRAMVVSPHVVRYRVEEPGKVVRVLTVRHGARRTT